MVDRFNMKKLVLLLLVNIFILTGCSDSEEAEAIRGISVSAQTLTVSVGKSKQVFASVYPYNAEHEEIKWSCSNSDIAIVEDKGTHHGVSMATVTGVSEGEVSIIVESLVNGSKKTVIATRVDLYSFEDLATGMDYSSDDLKTYRVPDGYPQEGDPLYNVSINGHYTGVYTDINAWKKLVSFAYFDFAPGKEVEVVIAVPKSFKSYKILPESNNISSTREGNNIRFKLKEAYKNLSVVFDNDYKGNTLHLFANAIETDAPTESNSNLVYFGPGYHDLTKTHGGKLTTGNKDVYIAGGAVVSGSIVVNGNGNRISGHGILMKTTPNDLVLIANYSKSTTFEGIIVCSHRDGGWTIGMHEASDVSVQNVKVVSPRYASTDGFDIVNSNNITLKNIFVRSCDDAIAIKGLIDKEPAKCPPNENMIFEQMQLWNDCNNAMCLGAETRAKHYKNIHFKDIDVLFSYDDRDNHTKLDERSVMSIVCLEGTYFEDITWENIRVNRCERLMCLTFKDEFWFGTIPGDQSTEGGIDGVTFKNISVASNSGSSIANEILLNGWYKYGTPTKLINNVTFDNVTIEGKRVSGENEIKTNNTTERKLVTGLQFN